MREGPLLLGVPWLLAGIWYSDGLGTSSIVWRRMEEDCVRVCNET